MMLRQLPRTLLLLAFAAAAATAHLLLDPPPPAAAAGPGEITVAAARALTSAPLWVDARTRAAHQNGHIPGALLLNNHEWDTLAPVFLDTWEPGRWVIVYCDGGACTASHEIAERIRSEFQLPDQVLVLKGGWDAWRAAR